MEYTKEYLKRLVEELDNYIVQLEKEISRLKSIKLKLERLKEELKKITNG